MMRALLAAACLCALAAARLGGRGGGARWPDAGLIFSDPAKPPPWMQVPAAWAPALPATPPAPVAPGALMPADPFVVNAAYHEDVAAGMQRYVLLPPAATKGGDAVSPLWPPSRPMGLPVALSGLPGMRPLTMVDAKGGEYAKDDPALSKA